MFELSEHDLTELHTCWPFGDEPLEVHYFELRDEAEGCQYSVSSCCGEVVRVQEAAESVASLELLDGGERGWWRRWLGRDGWAAAERSVRALGVVVIEVDA
jgi:hypothetical protein